MNITSFSAMVIYNVGTWHLDLDPDAHEKSQLTRFLLSLCIFCTMECIGSIYCFLFVTSLLVKTHTMENESGISLGRATNLTRSHLSLRKITFLGKYKNSLST